MAEGNSYSLIKLELGNLSKPADTLIKKVSEAVGGLYKPYQIERVAKAEAKAALIKTKSELEITDLHRRAMYRFVEEEAQRQKNIEDITAKAVPQLNEQSDPSKMENDWVTNFFEKARIVSDNEMQELWSRVLAGEANTPGTYSKRTVNFISSLDKIEAMSFSALCSFGWQFGTDVVPLIFDSQEYIYQREGVDFKCLSHLASIGLIQFNDVAGFAMLKLGKKVEIYYYGKPLVLEMPKGADNKLSVGKVLLSKTGQELAPICGSKPIGDFWDYVYNRWGQFLPKPNSEQTAALQSGPASVVPTNPPPVAS